MLQDPATPTLRVSSEEEGIKYYLKHCYPDVGQGVIAGVEAGFDGRRGTLQDAYIMEKRMVGISSGRGVSTSRDLDLGQGEKPVSQALDMYTAQRSELFVGNGIWFWQVRERVAAR
ncbi:hypothetical protein BYT27DRAFT_7214198 [Phlegmacium glaucopus]|nr:hypothetical protein BYT27DRAFT_7214198 [Phlegmacium glaucopus]